MNKDIKLTEKLDNLVKLTERKSTSLNNFKAKIINIRSLDSNFNDKTFIMKNCYELEEGIKQEIHSSSLLFEEVKDLVNKYKTLEANFASLIDEKVILLQEKKFLKQKYIDLDNELKDYKGKHKVKDMELRMKDREGSLQDSNVTLLAKSQDKLKTENAELKIRLHEASTDLKDTKSLLEELFNVHKKLIGTEGERKYEKLDKVEYEVIMKRQARIRRVSEIVHKLNRNKELFDFISSNVSLDIISSVTLMRAEERYIDKIEKLIIKYDNEASKEVQELIEYENEKKTQSMINQSQVNQSQLGKSKINESALNKSKLSKNVDFPSMTPKRGAGNILSLDSPIKKMGSNYIVPEPSELNLFGVSSEQPSAIDNSATNIKPSLKKKESKFTDKKVDISTNKSGINSPDKKTKSIYADQSQSKSPSKMISLPIPEKQLVKKKSLLDMRKEKDEEFQLIKEEYDTTKDLYRQGTLNK